MNSHFHSIFLVSVVVGALGLAFADSVTDRLSGGIGFVIGFVGAFVFFSLSASISDAGKPRFDPETVEFIKSHLEATTSQKESQTTRQKHQSTQQRRQSTQRQRVRRQASQRTMRE